MSNHSAPRNVALALLTALACASPAPSQVDGGHGDVAGAAGTFGASGSNGGGGSAGGNGARAGTGPTGAAATSGASGAGVGAAGNTGATGGAGASGRGGAAGSAAGTGGRAGSAGGGSAGVSGPSGPLVPAQGALLGAFVGTGTITQLDTTLGRKLAISHNFYGWADDFTSWARTTSASGYIPLVTWEPWKNSVGVSLDDIVGGVHDAMIRSRAQSSASIGQRFFLRWGHEMNGNWYPWDGFHNGANAAAAAKYIAAYRHIHDVFVSAGATNVIWVFCPNVDSVPGDAWNQWTNYYPGDAYVDWMGFDGYNWGTVQTGSSWRAFTSIAGAIYTGLADKAKPILIAETASTELGGDKAAWVAGILPALKTSYPSIKAVVWFHVNKETDWRIDSSAAARTAFVTAAGDAYFNP